MGWSARIDLRAGIASTYDWYRAQMDAGAHLRAK
jgi:nucleoside-diphosphate-sugar epimerase